MSVQLRVVVIDDNEWKRTAIAVRLDATAEVRVLRDIDQDSAMGSSADEWKDVDVVLVDVFDDRGPGEIGTDLFSGISVIEQVARLPVRSIAITPTCAHPLVQLRLQQAHPDFVYHRWQVANLDTLAEALRFPEREHRLPELDATEIIGFGARTLLANDAVRTYVESSLYATLISSTGSKELARLGISRRAVDRFKRQIVANGFCYPETLPSAVAEEETLDGKEVEPRWPVVRDLVLRLLGRLDAAPSEYDKPWWRD